MHTGHEMSTVVEQVIAITFMSIVLVMLTHIDFMDSHI